jgi:hypothetical protein
MAVDVEYRGAGAEMLIGTTALDRPVPVSI